MVRVPAGRRVCLSVCQTGRKSVSANLLRQRWQPIGGHTASGGAVCQEPAVLFGFARPLLLSRWLPPPLAAGAPAALARPRAAGGCPAADAGAAHARGWVGRLCSLSIATPSCASVLAPRVGASLCLSEMQRLRRARARRVAAAATIVQSNASRHWRRRGGREQCWRGRRRGEHYCAVDA
jgi:hypothetical protein